MWVRPWLWAFHFSLKQAVDVTGWLGGGICLGCAGAALGYNFQWAWASGHSAGSVCGHRDASREVLWS